MPIIDGKVVRARYTSLKLNELSAVDRPAQPGALATIMKRMDEPEPPSELAVALTKYICAEDGAHTFGEVLRENKFSEAVWPMTDALSQAIRSIIGDTEISADEREAKVQTSVQEFLASIRAVSPDVEKQIVDLIMKEPTMKTIEQLTAELEKANGQIASLTTELETTKAAVTKAAEEKDKAMAECEEAKKALVAATDEVITVGGHEIRKSTAGEANFTVAKALRDERDMAVFEKRAESEFSHLVGTTTEKALVLKHVEALPEDAKKAHLAILESAEKMVAMGFDSIGLRAGSSPTAKAATDGFNAKVSEIQKRDNINRTAAMTKARVEYPAEFAAYQGEGAAN